MAVYVQCFVLIIFLVVMHQFYSWIVSLEGEEKQKHCKALGVTYMTLGTVFLLFRSLPFVFSGLILLMLGFRLIAYGLDRLNKSKFIDRLNEEE